MCTHRIVADPGDILGFESSPRESSFAENLTPNTRLSSWAEQRNLSIDTDAIIARGSLLGANNPNRIVPKARECSSESTHSQADSCRRRGQQEKGKPKQVIIGCFSFLISCRKKDV